MNNHKKAQRIAAGIVLSAVTITALAAGGKYARDYLAIRNMQKQTLQLPKGFTVTAHAGALGTKANTLPSIEKCLAFIGSGCIEVDVRFGKDGTPILTHDATAGGNDVVLLADAMDLIAQYPAVRVNLDLKEYSNIPEIQRLAEEKGILPQLFFTGVTAQYAELTGKDAPGISYYLNESVDNEKKTDRVYLQALADRIKQLGAVGLNSNFSGASQELVDCMHENGLLVSLWTVNKRRDLCETLLLAPDNITSKKPNILLDLLENWNKK